MEAKEPLRVPVIDQHPHSSGFPKNHPSMTSFLGVPILAGEKQLGQIYLTDKIDADAFNEDDEKIIQMLETLGIRYFDLLPALAHLITSASKRSQLWIATGGSPLCRDGSRGDALERLE